MKRILNLSLGSALLVIAILMLLVITMSVPPAVAGGSTLTDQATVLNGRGDPPATAGGTDLDQALAQQGPPKQTPEANAESAAKKYFTDAVLVNQNGEKMRFYSDLLQGKVVIINSFFATCAGSCLPLTRNLEKLQAGLGARMGKDVYIISISVDPEVDTPAQLKAYAKKLNAGPGWYFLTGNKETVEFALKKIGHFVDNKENHLNIFIVGNERTGLWKKAFGLAKGDELMKVVESVLNDQPPKTQ